jgi:hypothetical protein
MGSDKDGMLYNNDRGGNPNVFNLERNEDGLWLNDNWANPGNRILVTGGILIMSLHSAFESLIFSAL